MVKLFLLIKLLFRIIYYYYFCYLLDYNEVQIVKLGGVLPIVSGAEYAAECLQDGNSRTEKESIQLEELATQCCRALRNLSVNRKYSRNHTYLTVLNDCLFLLILCFQRKIKVK
jgi:hypothetical protein